MRTDLVPPVLHSDEFWKRISLNRENEKHKKSTTTVKGYPHRKGSPNLQHTKECLYKCISVNVLTRKLHLFYTCISPYKNVNNSQSNGAVDKFDLL